MGTVIVICGNSLMESSCWKEEERVRNLPAFFLNGTENEKFRGKGICREYIKAKISPHRHPLGDYGPEALVDTFYHSCWEDGNPGMWGKMPVELFSLKKFFKENKNIGKGEYKVVLLHSQKTSNNPMWVQYEDEFCARIMEMILAQKGVVVTRVGFTDLSPYWDDNRDGVDKLVGFVSQVNGEVVVDLSGAPRTTGLMLARLLPPSIRIIFVKEEGGCEGVRVELRENKV